MVASPNPPRDRTEFHVAIICALPREADAVALLFDHFWDEERDLYGRLDGDPNTYITGRIAEHNIVLAVLPGIGTTDAAVATASLRSSYRSLKLAFIVGICGGIPSIEDYDVFLGDVVVRKAIIRYDYGRQRPGHFVVKGNVEDALGRPNNETRGLLAVFETEHIRERLQTKSTQYLKHLQKVASQKRRRANYLNPGAAEDKLYSPSYGHRHRTECRICLSGSTDFCEAAYQASCIELGCEDTNLVVRDHRTQDGDYTPEIFIGRVASGNTVMMSGEDRNRIAATHNIIAFEMEGAGAWDQIPCIVVKGVCDYADSHKNTKWQNFAAATAASVTKAMLEQYPANNPSDLLQDSTHTDGPGGEGSSRNISQNSFGANAKINQGDVSGHVTFW